MISLLLLFMTLLSHFTFAAEEKTVESKEPDIAKISEAFGHLIGKNIETLGVKFDIESVVKGLQEASKGKEAPMSETDCIQAISAVQETAFKKESQENLKKAEAFLAQNAKAENVKSLEEGKLQYKITQEGKGDTVQEHFTPLIRYCGKYIDGTVFGSSKEDEQVALDETIQGLKSGLIGMKEGEKRTLFVHPDLGYGTSGFLPPNSLLTFEVEIVKANVPPAAEDQAITTAPAKGKSSEIAQESSEALR